MTGLNDRRRKHDLTARNLSKMSEGDRVGWCAEPYVYESLPDESCIRLLRVLRKDPTTLLLHVELETRRLEQELLYNALSYTWGAPSEKAKDLGVTAARWCTIICNDRTLLITENLLDFLTRLLTDYGEQFTHPFWIDAISINQQDISERSLQLAMMTRIYRGARVVLIWLGEEDGETDDAIDLLRLVAETPLDLLKSDAYLDASYLPQLRDKDGIAAIVDRWRVARSLLDRTWFYRMWVIQEVLVARQLLVICGSKMVAWSILAKASEKFEHLDPHVGSRSSEGRAYKLASCQTKLIDHGLVDLHEMMTLSTTFIASDPRDQVFALLGITKSSLWEQGGPSDLLTNYRRPVSEIFTRVTRALVEDDSSLAAIVFFGRSYEPCSNCPTWVPNWAHSALTTVTVDRHYETAPNIDGHWSFSTDGRALGLEAYHISDIEDFATGTTIPYTQVVDTDETTAHTAHTMSQRPIFENKTKKLQDWIRLIYGIRPTSTTHPFDVFWRTVLCDVAGDVSPTPTSHGLYFIAWTVLNMIFGIENFLFDFDQPLANRINTRIPSRPSERPDMRDTEMLALLESFLRITADSSAMTQHKPVLPSPSIPNMSEWAGRFLTKAISYDRPQVFAQGSRLFKTSKLPLGHGNSRLTIGDSIFIVPGARLPVILRRAEESQHYHFVGPAYVHGVMHGEAFTAGPMEPQQIVID